MIFSAEMNKDGTVQGTFVGSTHEGDKLCADWDEFFGDLANMVQGSGVTQAVVMFPELMSE